jgi:xanthine phosphoribosyltransferase
MVRIGQELATRFAGLQPTKVLTAEISGIAPALEVGAALGVPVVFARKIWSMTMPKESYEFLRKRDRVLIIDDFLATGQTIEALASIVEESGAELVGIGTVIEKSFEEGRNRLAALNVPIESMAIVESMEDGKIVLR